MLQAKEPEPAMPEDDDLDDEAFATTRPLKIRLQEEANRRDLTVSALIREILEKFFEERK